MIQLVALMRWDTSVQARNGFYYASIFVALTMAAVVLGVPAIRAASALAVPAVFVFNFVITTFFFMTGLMLLERCCC